MAFKERLLNDALDPMFGILGTSLFGISGALALENGKIERAILGPRKPCFEYGDVLWSWIDDADGRPQGSGGCCHFPPFRADMCQDNGVPKAALAYPYAPVPCLAFWHIITVLGTCVATAVVPLCILGMGIDLEDHG